MVGARGKDDSASIVETIDASTERSVRDTIDAAVRPSTIPTIPAASAERYRIEREVGRGGMGVVLLAEDLRLGRAVAIKKHRKEADPVSTLRFVEEARATAQLEHPNIVPVYDVAEDARGAPFFSMRYVSGRSLREVIEALRAADPEARDAYGLAELLVVFLKICDAVAYAHARNVLHRDLKPENVMLGRFGEVFVMDWGLARVKNEIDTPETERSEERLVSSVRDSVAGLTIEGSILGTPGYMAPEQVRGRHSILDRRADVFALGAILYELLTLEGAIAGETATGRLVATITEDVVPPRKRAPARAISEALEETVLRAMSRDLESRTPSVGALRDEIARALEGSREAARKRAASEARLDEGRRAQGEHLRIEQDHDARLAVLEQRRLALGSRDDLEERRASWRDEAEVGRIGERAQAAFWSAYGAMLAAIQEDPKHDAARDTLVHLLVERARVMAQRGDRSAATGLEAIARQHDAVRAAALLDAPASIRIETFPSPAQVRIAVYEPEGPVLVERTLATLPSTPAEIELPPGSYVADLERAGSAPVRFPFVVHAGRARTLAIRLPDAGAVAPGFVVVPAGTWPIGGDRLAPGAEPRREVTLETFAIATHLVTMREYGEFLNALAKTDPGSARERAPRVQGQPLWSPDADRIYRAPFADSDGDTHGPDYPVIGVSGLDADAYVAWLARDSGHRLRLPSSEEWEVAARGADERAYPWGSGWDPTLCWNLAFRGASRGAHPVGSRPHDRSPFGLRDVAGLVRSWTATQPTPGRRAVRGGAYQASAEQCRIGRVTQTNEEIPYVTFSIRLAHSVP